MTRDARAGLGDPLDPDRDAPWPAGAAAVPAVIAATPPPLALVSAPQQQTFEVTTLADVVDAGDGVLSLREAIDLANANPGFDVITFADDLRGGRIVLDSGNGPLRVTDDLFIDGDPLDRVRVVDVLPEDREPAGITIDGGVSTLSTGVVPFEVEGALLGLEDLTIENAYGVGISGSDADILGNRIAVQFINGSPGIGVAIDLQGGGLQLLESSIGYTAIPIDVIGIRVDGATVSLDSSRIKFVNSESGFGISGQSPGVLLVDSEIVSARGTIGGAIRVTGDVFIDGSTISESGGRYVTGNAIEVIGNLGLVNSTIADSLTPLDAGGSLGAAIAVADGSTARLLNSTITGSRDFYRPFTTDGAPGLGIRADAGSLVEIRNSIIDDSVSGTIASNGANTFRDSAVDGALSGDRLGVAALDLFSSTINIGTSGLRTGVLADNGGPTQTIALRNDPANPAIDAADPATAPEVDQRGFLRDVAPDIGAFEFGAEPPLPIGDQGLIVTTLADEVVVDGEVSLREAVLTANANPGFDTITFADELFGGTITLTEGDLVITDDLAIDGDALNRGAASITIDGGLFGDNINQFGQRGFTPFRVDDASLFVEDLTIRDSYGAAIWATDATLSVNRVDIDGGLSRGGASGIIMDGGDLSLDNSMITDMSGDTGIGLEMRNNADATVANSSITGNGGYIGAGIRGDGNLTIVDSTIAGNFSFDSGIGVGFVGRLTIENSTIAGNGAVTPDVPSSGGVSIDGEATIVNSTITGNIGAGLLLRSGSDVGFYNSITLGNVRDIQTEAAIPGEPPQGGVFRTAGSLWGDTAPFQPPIEGLTADKVFAQTVLVNGTAAGVLANNGGPTQTVALLDDPANPALDTADPRFAPPLDQRGFARDATPDIGAFELGGAPPTPPPPAPPLPDLAEKVPLADADILGAPRGFLTLTGGDAAISFVDEYAAFQNSLGVYLVGPDETIMDPQWVFERVEHSEPSDLASELARPGGGPLSPGDTVLLSDLFDPADLGPGVEFGLFLVADGWSLNPQAIFDVGTLQFRTGDTAARVTDTTPRLFHIAEDGIERLVLGDIMHSIDAGSPNPLSNTLNPGGSGQVTSGLLDGLFAVAFEDKPLADSDRDFNDAIFAIDLLDSDDDLLVDAAAPPDAAALETLLTPAELV